MVFRWEIFLQKRSKILVKKNEILIENRNFLQHSMVRSKIKNFLKKNFLNQNRIFVANRSFRQKIEILVENLRRTEPKSWLPNGTPYLR